MEVCNIKFHFYIKSSYKEIFQKCLKDCEFVKKTLSSFCVLRVGKTVFSCFYSGYINATGVINFSRKHSAQRLLLNALKLQVKRKKIFGKSRIDNITAKVIKPQLQVVNLLEKKNRIYLDEYIISTKYDRQRFPNMFIKTVFGTIIWSPNNNITVVGSKNSTDLADIYKIITKLEKI